MRWTDLPPGRGPADAGASALPRGEWDDLRRRLERLPPGHPSRLGDEDLAGEDRAVDGLADEDRDDQGRADATGSPARRGVTSGTRGHHGGHGERGGLPGRREPYRPWFTAGESPSPWFAADPD